MKVLLLAGCGLAFFACNSSNSSEAEDIKSLKSEVATLRYQMDSLLLLRTADKFPPSEETKASAKGKLKLKKKTAANKPQTLYSSASSYRPPKKNKAAYSSQCQATTKKGYQCSRSARSGGYCWQHGG